MVTSVATPTVRKATRKRRALMRTTSSKGLR